MRYDHIVVGAGVMGAATAAALANRGKGVLLVEQFAVGHEMGSSHGRSRIFRFSYPDTMYVEMAQEALALWRRAEEMSSTSLLDITGGLDIGAGIDENARALEACGAQFEMASGEDLVGRFPYLRFDANVPVLFSPDSGTIAAERSVKAFVDLARAAGAELAEGVRVDAVEDVGDGAQVRCGEDVHSAATVVVTAGGWARSLLADAGIDLPVWVTRETVAFFALDERPPTLVDWGEPTVYALPSRGQGLKAGQHIAGPDVEPGDRGEPDRGSIAILSEWVAEHYPRASPEPHHVETCLYTNTDDQRFLLERHGCIVVGSPCSGHGFKFAPLIGERLAELASG